MQQYYDYKDKHKALLREQIARAHMERNNIEDDDVDIGDGAVEGDSEDLILIHVQDQSGAIAKLKVKNVRKEGERR